MKRCFFTITSFIVLIACVSCQYYGPGTEKLSSAPQKNEQEQAVLSQIETALVSQFPYTEQHYAVIGPYPLQDGMTLTQQFYDEASPRHMVQSSNETFYFAYDKRLMFPQNGGILLLIFEDRRLEQQYVFDWWPLLLREGQYLKELGNTEEERQNNMFRSPREPMTQQTPLPLPLHLGNLQDIPLGPSNECCHYKKMALIISTYAEMNRSASFMTSFLYRGGYSVYPHFTDHGVESVDELKNLISDVSKQFDTPHSECPCRLSCCGEFTLYLVGHGSNGIAVQGKKSFWGGYKSDFILYGRLTDFLNQTFAGKCIKMNLIIDACYSGFAMGPIKAHSPIAGERCEICIYTATDRNTPSFVNTFAGIIEACEGITRTVHGTTLDDVWQCVLDRHAHTRIMSRDTGESVQLSPPQRDCF